MKGHMLRAMVLAVAAVGGAVGVGARQTPAAVDAYAPTPTLTLRPVIGYPAGSDRPVAAWQNGSMSIGTALATSAPSVAMFGTGSVKGPAFCQAVTSGDPKSLDAVAGVGAYWRVEAQLVERKPAGAVVDLRWKRAVNQPDIFGEPTEVAQRVFLFDGEPVTLDFLRVDPQRFEDRCDSIAVTVELTLRPPQQVAYATLEYDMWLLQSDGGRAPRQYRLRTSAVNGERVRFTYPGAFYAADGAPAAREEERRFEMIVNGSIRGWLREDGSIDATVSSARFYWGVPRSIGTGGGGSKDLTLRSGETVEFELPGQLTGDLPGIANLDGIFAYHRTAIRITARRLW
jgi:hypothetical protein